MSRTITRATRLIGLFSLIVLAGQPAFGEVTLAGRWAQGPCSAVATHAGLVLIGNGSSLEIHDLTDPTEPEAIGSVVLPGRIRRIIMAGDLAYVADWGHGLQIVDVSSPAAPFVVGEFPTSDNVLDVAVDGAIAVTAESWDGVRILSIADPATPIELGRWDPSANIDGVEVEGDRVYVATSWGLKIVDIDNPAEPVEMGTFHTGAYGYNLALDGDLVYLTESRAGMHVVDVSDPTAPVGVGFLSEDVYFLGFPRIAGNLVYLPLADDGMVIADLSDPTQPTVAGRLAGTYAIELAVAPGRAYAGAFGEGARIIDVSDPAQPAEIGFVDTPDNIEDVAVAGSLAFVANRFDGLRIIEFQPGADPTTVGVCTELFPQHVCVDGTRAYAWGHDLAIVDAADPTAPVVVGTVDLVDTVLDATVRDDLACMVGGYRLTLVDVTNPLAPVVLSETHLGAYANGIVVAGDYALITGEGVLRIYSIFDVQAPAERGFVDFDGDGLTGVAVANGHAFVSTDASGIAVVDLSSVYNPEIVATIPWVERGGGVAVVGDRLYAADRFMGMRVIDVSDPEAPVDVGFYEARGWNSAVAGIDPDAGHPGYEAVMADKYAGLWFFDDLDLTAAPGPATRAAAITMEAWPNPANPLATIRCVIPRAGLACLTVHDLRGRRVRTLLDRIVASGESTVVWDGRDEAGRACPSGIYLARLAIGSDAASVRVALVK